MSPLNGWAVGNAGKILHYQRGGTTPTALNAYKLPTKFRLEQNYRNPGSTTTTNKYEVAESGLISLKIFDAMGTEVASLLNERKQVGNYSIEWNAAGLRSGIYF